MKYVILAERTFQYLDLGPDFDEPIFGTEKQVFEMEFLLEDLPNVDKIIKRRLRNYHIIKYEVVHNPPTKKQIDFLQRYTRSSNYAIRTMEKTKATKLIAEIVNSWENDRDRLFGDPIEDWLQERYNGGGE